MKRRVLNLLIALDQLAWVILTLGNGMPDETISAALWRMESQGKWAGKLFRPVVDALFWFDRHHCFTAWQAERKKQQLPAMYR
ncbi:MAG: hypothetical protein KA181_00125 [Xylophilus sp.]|nr:hypothetical protein [Xylophilus sp.]